MLSCEHRGLYRQTAARIFFANGGFPLQIKGYLLIYNVDIRSIDFPNLKIIWGDDLLDETSALTLSSNLELKELRMPKLRAIHKGNVRIENSTFLCYLQSKVNWNELLEDDAANRLITSDSAFRQCNPSLMKCTGCQHCWSGKQKYCQEEYRSVCGDKCASQQCYLPANSSDYECCHEACTGGCTGRGAHQCVACRELSLDGVCVHQCPPMMVHDPKRGMLIPNPKGRYVYDRYCVEECPKELLVERDACVRHCSVGSHHDMTKDSRRCEPCKGVCPKGELFSTSSAVVKYQFFYSRRILILVQSKSAARRFCLFAFLV
ncbi:receptor L domain protein [Ancylostoma caninum]|uniref:receptor protein-tyrosine kinase n=1 Tax=Ancylostoma caninum TaxID=29170 RepID=A0A368FSK7_ANCCA|nr:receptor L domain protein [Ancylostoma caninum]